VTLRSVVIVGTGLIGTSVALALRGAGQVRVWLSDADPESERLAVSLGAGQAAPPGEGLLADVALLAVPPAAVAAALAAAQARRLARVYTDVASVKQQPVEQAAALGCDMASYVPGHPLAGRERHGPGAARADLFLGRTWALCPSAVTDPAAIELVSELIRACGADEVRTDPATHDQWVALVSHAPHVVASAMAARLERAPDAALALAGQGLRDTTRVAAGDPGLWRQILGANATPVARILAEVSSDLAELAHALTSAAPASPSAGLTSPSAGLTSPSAGLTSPSAGLKPEISDISGKAITDLLERGRAGVARIPGKHGQQQRPVTVVQVVIRDKPGELARLFAAAGEAGVNIEDIRIEHSPGLPVGVAELSIRPGQVPTLLAAMEEGGWPARG
jgi:prephenate dehydrogenase